MYTYKNKSLFIYCLLLFFIVGCGDGGFEKTTTGLYFKVNKKGMGLKPQNGDMLLINMLYQTEAGDTVYSTDKMGAPAVVQYYDTAFQKDGGLMELIGMLKEGDSVTIKIEAKKMFQEHFDHWAAQYNLEENSPIFVHTGLQTIMKEDSFKIWEAEQIALFQKRLQEKAASQLQKDTAIIQSYLKEHTITAQATASGLHYTIHQPGKGSNPQSGNKVKVNYTGRTLDGKVFDTSVETIAKENGVHNPLRTYAPFEFPLGDHKVIQGWEEGIKLLKKGARATLFIPSTLAYGAQAQERIPANSVLIFEIEVIDIL